MTIEDVIDYINCALAGGCSQVCNTKYRGQCTDEQVVEAARVAIKTLKKQGKYRWHSLKDDPNDVPDSGKPVLIEYDTDFKELKHDVVTVGSVTWVSHIECRFKETPIIAWREIDSYEEGDV